MGGCTIKDAKLRENMKAVIKALPPKSLHRHVLLATVASSNTSEYLKADFGLDDQTIIALQKCFQDGHVLEPDR